MNGVPENLDILTFIHLKDKDICGYVREGGVCCVIVRVLVTLHVGFEFLGERVKRSKLPR